MDSTTVLGASNAEVAPAGGEAPLVTIAIPTFNRADLLARALQSALDQDYPNLEIVVCDNASPDETPAVVARVGGGDPRLRYIRHPENRGELGNYRSTLAQARGRYFMWLCDDDWIDRDYVSACYQVLRAHPGASLAAGVNEFCEGDRLDYVDTPVTIANRNPAVRAVRHIATVVGNGALYGVAPTELVRRVTVPTKIVGWDWVLVCGLAAQGTAHLVPGPVVHRNLIGGSSSWDKRYRPFGLPCARLMSSELRSNPAFSGIPRWQRQVAAGACHAAIFWRIACRPPLVRAVRSVTGSRYEKWRGIYRRVLSRPA